jgi:hypothetical protein
MPLLQPPVSSRHDPNRLPWFLGFAALGWSLVILGSFGTPLELSFSRLSRYPWEMFGPAALVGSGCLLLGAAKLRTWRWAGAGVLMLAGLWGIWHYLPRTVWQQLGFVGLLAAVALGVQILVNVANGASFLKLATYSFICLSVYTLPLTRLDWEPLVVYGWVAMCLLGSVVVSEEDDSLEVGRIRGRLLLAVTGSVVFTSICSLPGYAWGNIGTIGREQLMQLLLVGHMASLWICHGVPIQPELASTAPKTLFWLRGYVTAGHFLVPALALYCWSGGGGAMALAIALSSLFSTLILLLGKSFTPSQRWASCLGFVLAPWAGVLFAS